MLYKRNIADMAWSGRGRGARFRAERKSLTPVGESFAPKLGASLYRVEPGMRAFPFHGHSANDEAILVTRGSGEIRHGEERHAISEGDWIYLPAASGVAHQVINTSAGPLEYLCLSTMIEPDVCFYPDSGKYVVAAGAAPGGDPKRRSLFAVFRDQGLDYWDGEE